MLEFALLCGALIKSCIHLFDSYKGHISPKFCHPNLDQTQARSKAVFCLYSRMVKTFDCIKCGGHHVRTINRNCKMEKDKDTPVDANSQILQELRNLSGRMTQMEDKMEALGSTVSSPARSKTSSMSPQRSPATSQRSQAMRSPEQDLILPSLSTLRQSRSVQEQVDTRICELQGLDKGKFKLQRGGSETIWVKKEVASPHNHVLGGSSKNRVNYDNLTISQWVSGFATIIRDESDLSIKNQMLEYLAEIIEDSHDFGWGLRKARMQCYCVRWRRAELHGTKPKRLTVFSELTLIGRPPYLKVHIVTKSRAPKTNQCHVGIIRKILALIRAIMTLVADCICTFVAIAIHRAKVRHICLKTARKQKTSSQSKTTMKTIAFL